MSTFKQLPLIFFLLFVSSKLFASDVIEILPLTNKVIMVHLKDGYAIYHKNGEQRSHESVVVQLLNVTEAAKTASYVISSADDPNYSTPKNPTAVGRKTKGTEFTWMCQAWDNTKGCINTDPDHVKEHWIYLTLPSPLEKGKTYVFQTTVAGNGNTWSFTFDETKLRSEAIHVNQIGYSTRSPQKFGYVYLWMGDKGGLDLTTYDNNTFNILDITTASSVFSGQLKFRKSKTNPETGQTIETPNANFLSADVYECDFSAFNTPGEYMLQVDGIGSSFPFKIDADIYRMPFYTAIRGLYHNRSGIALTQPFTEFTRPAPQNPNLTPGFSGKLRYTRSRSVDWKNEDNDPADKPTIEAADKGPINTWGWYQDAGDWDSYSSHLIVPALLMFTWEAAPQNFRDSELNIPESGNSTPDILDEAAWLLRFCYRTRHEILDKGYGTGGLGMRVFGDLWGKDEAPNGTGRGSWQDNTRTWYVSGEDPYSTYKYAALAAQMAFCLKTAGLTDTINWQKEAGEAYTWASNNTKTGDETKHSLKEIRAYAAASLYRITEEAAYHQQFKTDVAAVNASTYLRDEARWAPYIYTGMPDSIAFDNTLYEQLKAAVVFTANSVANVASGRACRYGGDYNMPMLVGQATTPWVFEAVMGYKLTKNTDPAAAQKFLGCVFTSADYFLGCNPLNTTWITGLGIRQPDRLFHMDSWYNGKREMSPGITPYGPWRVESYSSGQGAWDLKWPHKSIYPADINSWPGHERWFGNFTCPLNAEFTIHQNTIFNAAIFGFLCNTASEGFVPNRRPEISFLQLTGEVVQNTQVPLAVNVTDPDGNDDIYKVEYYNGWHKIGESTESPFSFKFNNIYSGQLKLTARVTDKKGMVGRSDTLKVSSKPDQIDRFIKTDLTFKAFPNPFSSRITFEYTLERDNQVRIEIFDLTGKKVNTVQEGFQKAGTYFLEWEPLAINQAHLVSGFYICRFGLGGKKDGDNYMKLFLM